MSAHQLELIAKAGQPEELMDGVAYLLLKRQHIYDRLFQRHRAAFRPGYGEDGLVELRSEVGDVAPHLLPKGGCWWPLERIEHCLRRANELGRPKRAFRLCCLPCGQPSARGQAACDALVQPCGNPC
jgi:hypothetical protein